MEIFTANGCYTLPFIWELSRNPWDFQPGTRPRWPLKSRSKTPEYKSEATMSASAPLAAKGNNNGEAGPMSPTKFHKMANGQQKMRRFLEE